MSAGSLKGADFTLCGVLVVEQAVSPQAHEEREPGSLAGPTATRPCARRRIAMFVHPGMSWSGANHVA
jgi:hypothetical protein